MHDISDVWGNRGQGYVSARQFQMMGSVKLMEALWTHPTLAMVFQTCKGDGPLSTMFESALGPVMRTSSL